MTPTTPASEPRRPGRVITLSLLTLALVIGGCTPADDAPQVVLYVSADEHFARQVVAAFEEATGVRVRMVGDIESKKTTGLVARLRSERDHPQADVFWSSEIFQTIQLAGDGVLAPYASDATASWPAEWRDADDRWYGFAARARVIVYAPDRVSAEDVPRSWTDLTRSYYRGRIVLADPRFGTTGGHLGAMKVYWDRRAMPGYYEAWLMGLRSNEVRLLPNGNAGVVQAVADGEADLGLTDTDDVWAARANGRNVEMVLPVHTHEVEPGRGTLLIPNTVGLVAGAPNPNEAGRLIDFLLSEKVERLLAESVSHNLPLRPGLAGDYPSLVVDDPLAIDYHRAARARASAIEQATRILTSLLPEAPAEAPPEAPESSPPAASNESGDVEAPERDAG